MKRRIIITSLILSGILILDSMNIPHALMMFLIAGNIPGTAVYLDADTMLALFMMIFGIMSGRLTSRLITRLATVTPQLKLARKKV